MFGLGPAYLFVAQHRLPIGLMRDGWRPWISAMATNSAIVLLVGTLIWLVGIGTFLLVQVPVTLLAASIGVWLFYVQHQFEHTHWDEQPRWNFHEAGLARQLLLRIAGRAAMVHGGHRRSPCAPPMQPDSLLSLGPRAARSSRSQGHRSLTLGENLRCIPLVLWDESQRRLISFREMRRRYS